MTRILAIETSCDETGVAVMSLEGDTITVQAEVLASQIDIHKETGGVVPEVAAREHVKVLPVLVKKVLADAGIANPKEELNAIAVTFGPGLMPALAIGVQMARTLAFAWDKPVIPVHHLEGHIVSALLGSQDTTYALPQNDVFPALGLIVSGGHTMLVHVSDMLSYKILGQTKDDAAGEVFDKVARMLELPYPGGPHVSKLAAVGNRKAFPFPRPMAHSGDLAFSFSGLKTAVLYTLRDNPIAKKEDVAASFEAAVIDSLVGKTKQALQTNAYKTLLLSGGVAANTYLREQLATLAQDEQIPLNVAPLALCGDNGVMIGQAGLLALQNRRIVSWKDVAPKARVALGA